MSRPSRTVHRNRGGARSCRSCRHFRMMNSAGLPCCAVILAPTAAFTILCGRRGSIAARRVRPGRRDEKTSTSTRRAREAERAGFRPCKRCRPNEPALAERRAAAVAKACRLMEAAEEMPTLEALAEASGMSRFHFHRVFKATTGVTPKAYAAAHRAQRVRDELGRTGTVTEAIYGAGFNSNGHFYATASDLLGMTPTTFRSAR